jgi:magnesium transporter
MAEPTPRAPENAAPHPETLVHVGKKRTEKARVRIVDYDEAHYHEQEATTAEESFPFKDRPTTTWISVEGLHQVEIVEAIGKHFGLHPLLQEDILNTSERPKMDDFGDYMFVVLKMLHYDDDTDELDSEQVSLIIGPSFTISFQESASALFEPVRERLRTAKGRIRKMGPDYLAYTLMDAIVDNYFVVLERLGEKLESLEEELVADPRAETVKRIHKLRREMIFVRKAIWPLREVVGCMDRGDSALLRESTVVYLRDLYDHTIQVMESVETLRDMLSGMLDIYLSSVSNRLNEVMKVLTIIATIFIPLTFVAGVYGMNFKYMPELGWRWAYPALWAVMAAMGIGMLAYFRKKRWF